MTPNRRTFLQSAAAAGSFLVGCSGKEDAPGSAMDNDARRGSGGFPNDDGVNSANAGGTSSGSGGSESLGGADPSGGADATGGASGVDCDDPFAGGEYLGDADFVGESTTPLDSLRGAGWDARLRTDLRNVDHDNLIIPNETFFIRTRYPDLLSPPADWEINVKGLATSAALRLDDLLPHVKDMGASWLECSGNGKNSSFGLLSAAEWSGIPLQDVFDRININSSATQVLISGFDDHSVPSEGNHSTPGASWIFSFDQLAESGAFLATKMNGVALPADHGAPVRLIVPGWYGCTNIKWVNEIRFVDDEEPPTSQMIEFASRTHQPGTPSLARNFLPATADQAAMPVRIEKWRVDGAIKYRVVGIMWGGYELTNSLQVRYGPGESWQSVDVCPAHSTNRTWTVWSHEWTANQVGDIPIVCRINDPAIPTRRLDREFYERVIRIDEI